MWKITIKNWKQQLFKLNFKIKLLMYYIKKKTNANIIAKKTKLLKKKKKKKIKTKICKKKSSSKNCFGLFWKEQQENNVESQKRNETNHVYNYIYHFV